MSTDHSFWKEAHPLRSLSEGQAKRERMWERYPIHFTEAKHLVAHNSSMIGLGSAVQLVCMRCVRCAQRQEAAPPKPRSTGARLKVHIDQTATSGGKWSLVGWCLVFAAYRLRPIVSEWKGLSRASAGWRMASTVKVRECGDTKTAALLIATLDGLRFFAFCLHRPVEAPTRRTAVRHLLSLTPVRPVRSDAQSLHRSLSELNCASMYLLSIAYCMTY